MSLSGDLLTKLSEAKAENERLRNELHLAQDWSARVIAGQEEDVSEITRLRADNERLREALREVMDDLTLISKNHWLPVGLLDDVIYVNARAALEAKRISEADGQPAPGKEEA